MKKTLKLSLILASSLLLSACGRQSGVNQTTETGNQLGNKFSLRELISNGVAQKCTYSSNDEDGSYTGEIIINGQKFKQIIKLKSTSGEEETVYTISDGEYYYSWGVSGGQAFATKMKADFGSEDNPEVEQEDYVQGEVVDLDDDFQGNCSPTTVSDSDFQVPTDVEFIDYTQMVEQWQNMDVSDFMNLE